MKVLPFVQKKTVGFIPRRVLYNKNGFQIAQGNFGTGTEMRIGIAATDPHSSVAPTNFTIFPKEFNSGLIEMLFMCELTGINFPQLASTINQMAIYDCVPANERETIG